MTDLTLSFDQGLLLSTSFDNSLRLWDVRAERMSENYIQTFKGFEISEEKNLIRSSMNHDGKMVATGDKRGQVFVFL